MRRVGRVALTVALLAMAGAAIAAERIPADIAERLTPQQVQAYSGYLVQRNAFERQLEMYWALVEERREHRKRKYVAKVPFVADDYVAQYPPKYVGPPMPVDVQVILTQTRPTVPDKPLPGLADFLESARAVYGFQPTLTTERLFKRAYAQDALQSGLTKDQVVRVYALETGGRGTFDMQAGIDPDTKQGRPISSAIGYAQLLHANSVSELVKHGDGFIQRLYGLASRSDVVGPRRAAIIAKANVLKAMLRNAKMVPNEWSAHQQMAKTPNGLGIHALNLDADVGPWLQVLKLRGLLETAAREAGRGRLTGAELELMNLAGPRTGLEMMQAVGRTMPTSNFFSQGGYYRNTIVREKNGMQLLAALEERMEAGLKKPGSIEFAQVFDEVALGVAPLPSGVGGALPAASVKMRGTVGVRGDAYVPPALPTSQP
ncbi:MAG: hypothetical protein ABL898_06135 [Hyphomicrobiaceae bacterium]|nr:hypothetical protein [Hyphomicrobiaceae bacterium]